MTTANLNSKQLKMLQCLVDSYEEITDNCLVWSRHNISYVHLSECQSWLDQEKKELEERMSGGVTDD